MGNQRQQQSAAAAHPPPPSPTTKASKYTNKDGSKFITIPKASSSTTGSAQPSPSLDPSDDKTGAPSDPNGPNEPAPTVNRKKQKRRLKEAAKKAEAQEAEARQAQAQPKQAPPSPTDSAALSYDRRSLDVEHDFSDAEDEPHQPGTRVNGAATPGKSKKSKKKKKRAAADDAHDPDDYHDHHDHHDHVHHQRGHNHAPQTMHRASGMSRENIWNTNSQEERQRIKDFWLGLGEDERKSLVKVEKEAVLNKMKEQQKQTCSCTVCGRKRTAIEEELEGLYDAYYEELEQYAHTGHPNGEGPPMMGSPKHLGPVGNAVGGSRGHPSNYPHQPSHGRMMEHVSDDEDEEEEDDYGSGEELDDEEYDEDEPPEVNSRDDYAKDFFTFGQSLTVQGGILTVADDLLKNDGRKFIEMMEQLAERRMQREEEAKDAYSRGYGHTNGAGYHNHPPPEEEEYDDDEEEYEEDDEEDYDSQEEEQDAMTEEQRMEEGRRMFQIFAARMFEQRVLKAYKEKKAEDKRREFFDELDNEKLSEEQKKAKKAREAQKRKEKAAKKKEALAAEKARKEAEKAAKEAARKAEEEAKAAEQRQKAEEKRRKKEEQRKAEEQERLRKEAERQKARERQAEQERKAREAKEKEKKAREEAARQKEKEAKERKEQEARERKEQQDREKKEREAKSKADREAREKSAQALVQTQAQPQQKVQPSLPRAAEAVPAVQKATTAPPTATPIVLAKRPAQHAIPTAIPALPQQPPLATATATTVASPQIAVATPAIPKAPLSMRNRQLSQQESTSGSSQTASQSESIPSQAPSPHPLTPSHTSPGPIGSIGRTGVQQQSHSASPMSMASKAAASSHFGGFSFGPAPPGMPPMPPPGFNPPMQQSSTFAPPSPFSHFANPGMGGIPGSIGRQPPGRPFVNPPPPPGFNGASESFSPGMSPMFQPGLPRDALAMPHQRQNSIGLDHPSPSQASGKPVPIGRPPSAASGPRPGASLPSAGWGGNIPESQALGSSALLADSEEAPQDFPPTGRRNTSFHPLPGSSFTSMVSIEPSGGFSNHSPWTPPGQPSFYGSPPQHGLGGQWPTAAQPTSLAFGPPNGVGRHQNRAVTVRQLLCHTCREVAESAGLPAEDRLKTGHVSLRAVKERIDQHQLLNQQEPTTEKELLGLSDTLGNAANGGGSFDVIDKSGQRFVLWMPDESGANGYPSQRAPIGAPGQHIGSPVVNRPGP